MKLRSLRFAGIAMVLLASVLAFALYRAQTVGNAAVLEAIRNLDRRIGALETGQPTDLRKLPPQVARDLEAIRQARSTGSNTRPAPGKGWLGESLTAEGKGDPIADAQTLARELDALHSHDKPDAKGGPVAETQLEALAAEPALVQNKLIPHDLQTDCRASRCRIVAKFRNGGAAQDWATMLTTLSGSTLSYAKVVQIPLPDGGIEVRIYGARK